MLNNLQIKVVAYKCEFTSIEKIRYLVFQKEQNVAPELEFDGKDEQAKHLLAYLNDEAVGTLRIRTIDDKTVKIERLAVLPIARRQGIGRNLMEYALNLVASSSDCQVIIHAQEYIEELYLKLGFEQVGNRFEEAGIPHVKMIYRRGGFRR
ncbi:MAG: GNAT family N-acetyltransferase [Xenococcaceae cyanobacterium]